VITAPILSEGARQFGKAKDARSLTTREIGNMLGGVSAGLVSAWLTGTKTPNDEHRENIERVFGIAPESFEVATTVPPASALPPRMLAAVRGLLELMSDLGRRDRARLIRVLDGLTRGPL
jgi:transcriptional regulator with XRE-family HTH domain